MLIVAVVFAVASFSVFFVLDINKSATSTLFSDSTTPFELGWQNKYGLSYDVSSLSKRDLEFDSETPLYLFRNVPEFTGEAVMFFRTNNLVVNVYIDDECIAFTAENGNYNNLSSFSSYFYIPLSSDDIGKEMKLEIYKTPVSLGFCIDNFVFGNPGNVMKSILSNDYMIIIAGVLTVITGIVFIWIGFISRKAFTRYRGLLFFGISSVLLGMWFLADTIWLYNSVGNISIIEQCSSIFLSASIPCFMMYVYEHFNINNKKFYVVLTVSGFALFIFMLLFNMFGIMSYGYSKFILHVYILICSITLLAEMISYLTKITGNKGESKIFNIGVIFFASFVIFDLGRFYQGNEGDSSYSTRFGIFILVVTVIASTTDEFVELLELGIKAGKIGKIAFTDANTGLGNPAAFKNKFEELDMTKGNYSYIGIIQFDVNNLKIINDTLGHEMGDLLIKNAAEIIEESFGAIGSCYRVGGDEFVAITTYNHAPLVCEDAILKFEAAIERFNRDPDRHFDLRIAYGVAYYQNDSRMFQSLKEVHKLADERMYNKKKELKARYAKTPEEAVIR